MARAGLLGRDRKRLGRHDVVTGGKIRKLRDELRRVWRTGGFRLVGCSTSATRDHHGEDHDDHGLTHKATSGFEPLCKALQASA
jgi:hypothetical protein